MSIAAETAAKIAEAITATGEATARVWQGGEHTRVYVSRELSRGRRQDMGYVGVDESGEVVSIAMDRRRAWVESIVAAATTEA